MPIKITQPSLTIGAVQSTIEWLDPKWNFQHLDALLFDLKPVDLLLLPETFATGFSVDVEGCEELAEKGAALLWLKEKSCQLNCVVAGSVLVKKCKKKVNRFYWVWPNGEVQFYDKRHLFRLGKEHHFVIPGDERKIIEINGVRILPQVCYDLRFPVWSRNRSDYDMIVNVANWPGVRRNVWDTLLKARAMENQAFVVGVNRVGSDGKGILHSGGTAIYDFYGEPIAVAKDNHEVIIYGEIDIHALNSFKEKFPSFLDADAFTLQQ